MSESIARNLVRDIGIVGLSNVLIMLSGILLLRAIAPTLGVTEYGYYVQFTVTLSLVYTFVPLGLPYATVRFLSGCKDRAQMQDDVWSTMLLIVIASLIASALFLLFAGVIANALFGGNVAAVTILGLMIPVECMNVTMLNLFRVFQHNIRYAAITTVRTYADVLLIVWLVGNGYGLTEIFLGMLALRAIAFVLLLGYTLWMVGPVRPRLLRMRQYFHFGLPNIPANVASWVSDVSDRYLLGLMKNAESVGYYNPGYTLGQVISMFMAPFDFVLVSAVSKYHNEGRVDLVRDIFRFSLKYYLFIAIPACFGVTLLSKPILAIIATPEIAEQGYLVTPFVALSMLLFGAGTLTFGKALFLANRNDINAGVWIFMAIVNFVLNLAMIPAFGIVGAAAATMIAYLLGFIISTYFARRYFIFVFDWQALVKIIVASLAMSIVVYYMNPLSLVELLETTIAGFIVYLAVALLLGTIKKSEISYFMSFRNVR